MAVAAEKKDLSRLTTLIVGKNHTEVTVDKQLFGFPCSLNVFPSNSMLTNNCFFFTHSSK